MVNFDSSLCQISILECTLTVGLYVHLIHAYDTCMYIIITYTVYNIYIIYVLCVILDFSQILILTS